MKYLSPAPNATETEYCDYTIDFLMFKTMNFISFYGKSLYAFSSDGSNKLLYGIIFILLKTDFTTWLGN